MKNTADNSKFVRLSKAGKSAQKAADVKPIDTKTEFVSTPHLKLVQQYASSDSIRADDIINMDRKEEEYEYNLDFEQYLVTNDQAPAINNNILEVEMGLTPTPPTTPQLNHNISWNDTWNELNITSNSKTLTYNHGNNDSRNNQQKRNNNNYNNNSNNNNYGGSGDSGYQRDDGDDDEKKQNNGWKYINEHDDDTEDKEEELKEYESESTLNIAAVPFIPVISSHSPKSNILEPIHEDDEENIDNIENNGNKLNIIHPMQMVYDKREQTKSIQDNSTSAAKYSYDPNPIFRARNNIKIPEILTNTILPNRINKERSNLYRYIDKTTSLQISNGCFKLCNNDTITIISYDFYDKKINQTLYCVITKQQDSIIRPFKMRENVYVNEIVNEFNINIEELPNSLRTTPQFMGYLNHENKIKNVINTKLNINNIKWHKMNIYIYI